MQGFPQVLRTWGGGGGGVAPQNYMGGVQVKTWGELKILSKNTCKGVHLMAKLPALSLQASKFTTGGGGRGVFQMRGGIGFN